MSLLDTLLQALGLDALYNLLISKFPIIGKYVNLGQKIIEHFTGTFNAGIKLFDSFESEVAAFKNFKEDFRFRQRVVNIETAITKIRDLVQGLFDSYNAVVDIIKNLSTKVELGGAAEIVEAASGIGLPVALVNAIVLVVEVLDTIRNVIDDLQTVIDEITRIREAIETADTIFLQQRNPRRTVRLDDGSSIKLRIGHLHS